MIGRRLHRLAVPVSKRMRAIAFWTIFFLSLYSASAQTQNARQLTIEGLQLFYNLDLNGAYAKFDKACAADRSFPQAALFKSLPSLWKLLSNKSHSDYDRFLILIDTAIDVADARLDRNSRDTDALYSIGTAYLYRAFARGKFESYIKAAWDARKGYKYLEDCIAIDTNYNDAYLGLGAIHYATGTLPKTLRWMLSIISVESDTRKGIEEVARVAEGGRFMKSEAQFYLGMYRAFLEESILGVDLLKNLSAQYPDNVIFLYNYACAEMRQKHLAEARPVFLKIVEIGNKDFDMMTSYSLYRMGETAFRENNYVEALRWYGQFLQRPPTPQFRVVACLRKGICEEILGNRDQAAQDYQTAVSLDGINQEDKAAIRKAERLEKRSLSSVDILLIKADNLFYAGEFSTIISMYNQLLNRDDLTSDEQAEVYNGLGRTYFDLERLDEAKSAFEKVFTFKISSETWIRPWTHYYLAEIAWKRGDKTTARSQIDFALDADDCDYKTWLIFSAERLREKL